jgi:putative oxidoreductase
MKIAYIIVRVLMGLLFIFGSVAFFLKLGGEPQLEGNMKTYFEGLAASIYFLPFLKITELVCGIALVAGRFVPLACVILAPIIINILFVHIFLETTGLPVAILLVLANSFLAYYNRDKYKPLFEAK